MQEEKAENICLISSLALSIPLPIFYRIYCRVFIQVLCSYSTLPLYAIVTQVGCSDSCTFLMILTVSEIIFDMPTYL